MLSVVIPISNGIKSPLLQESLQILTKSKFLEIIIVNKKKSDSKNEDVSSYGINFISTDKNSRAERLNIGIQSSNSRYVLLHHPRNKVTEDGLHELITKLTPLSWGGFTHTFHHDSHPLLNFTSWYSNKVRFDKKGILYLDHCIFFDKDLLPTDEPYLPPVDIFEDTLFSLKLLKRSHPIRLNSKTYTSAVRFRKKGLFKQSLLNQILKLSFWLGISKTKMNKVYEKDLNLNSEYPSNKDKEV